MFKFFTFIFIILISFQATALDKNATWCSLKSDKSYMRTGPGKRYPIKWVYKQKYLPFQILNRHDGWLKVKDYEGETGWFHPNIVSSRRTFIITEDFTFLQNHENPNSKKIAKLEKGASGEILDCKGTMCKVEVQSFTGFIPKNSFLGEK